MGESFVRRVTIDIDGALLAVPEASASEAISTAIEQAIQSEAREYVHNVFRKTEVFKALVERAAYDHTRAEFARASWITHYMEREIQKAVSDAALRAVSETLSVSVNKKESPRG